ncbi:MAG: TonB-dependent receptor [Gemmatimonadota bacterium]|nr:TonB-dependent receptor [Gemmatimonadota bacterium]
MRPSNPWRALGALVFLVLNITAARAAEAAASDPAVAPPVTGVVRDMAGNPLPNARVVVAELGRATTTAGDGTFAFRELRAGSYHLDATLLGYAPGHVEVVVPQSGPEVRVTITLEVTALALSGLQVTASALSEDPLRVTQSTIQLTGKELARNLGTTVAQTLAEQPGISTRYAGPAASVPVIRGLTGERILVLQDGQRAGDLSSTSADHALSVDPLVATQIEVVRGPASLLYGNNALGGVVNVISGDIPTSVPSHLEGYVGAQAESVNPGGGVSASVTLPVGEFIALSFRGGGRSIDDVRTGDGGQLDNTQFRNLNGMVGIGYIQEALSGGVAYRGYGFDYGLPAAPDDEEAGIRIEGTRHEATGRADLSLGTSSLPYLRLEGTAQWYRHDEIEPDGAVGTTFDLRTQTANLTGRTHFGSVRGAVGLSALFKQYAPTGEEALTPPANSSSGGVFLFQEVPLSGGADDLAPRLQLGARYDLYRIETDDGADESSRESVRDFRNVSGSVGLNVPLNESLSASVSVARAFRAPSVEELFSNGFHIAVGTFDIGNPDLKAETNQGIDGVLRAQTTRLVAQVSAYYNRINNYVAPNIVGDTLLEEEGDSSRVPLNIFRQEDASLRGIEGQIEATVARHVVIGAMGDVIRGEFSGGSPLPFMPAARIGGSVRWDDGRYSVGTDVRRAFAQDRVEANELATNGYTLVDLSAGMTLLRSAQVHSITLRADNVFDVLYREATSRIKEFAPNPGRNLSLVYRVLF